MRNFRMIICLILLSFAAVGCGAKTDRPQAPEPSSEEEKLLEEQVSEEEKEEENSVSGEEETAEETETADVKDPASFDFPYERYALMTPEEITAEMTPEEKAAQMVQTAVYMLTPEDMKEADYGSILSKFATLTCKEWQDCVDTYQEAAICSESGIPYLYGQDDVHGVNYCMNAVYFPHNIGLGAANDPALMYEIGLATADEAKLCHMLWNFSPCLAQSADPRWGRTYESYGADLEIISSLGSAYIRGLQDGGIAACAKHFFGDGNALYGTGEKSDYNRLIDRGDARLTDKEIQDLLAVYETQVRTGVQTIMLSHTSLNGVKMHENAKYIRILKEDMGFEGFIVSDWNSVQNTSPSTYRDQVITGINSGIDMLMEVDRFKETRQIISDAIKSGEIPEQRADDAVRRIIKVKQDLGLFEDPMCEHLETRQSETGSEEYRALAEKAVEKSLVLLKNEGDLLPLKEGSKVYVTGPAADNASVQCGGWTIEWRNYNEKAIPGVTTILEGLKAAAADKNIEILTDPNRADEADLVLLFVGEKTYAEWYGDTEDMDLCGNLGLEGNRKAIEEAKALGKPIAACIVAGRQVLIEDYRQDWDSIVMCFLPGSEGKGVADVLTGSTGFTGRLPSPWYRQVSDIGTDRVWLEQGYGLTY